jgi:hypothetical protein
MPDPTYTPDPARREPDLRAFAKAVRFRDSAVARAVAHHSRTDLQPSSHYARATFDAIEGMIREDERAALAAAGRLLPADAEREWSIRTADGYVSTVRHTERSARLRAADYGLDNAAPVHRAVGPWLPVPADDKITEESPDAQ